jgi:methyl-branched lipid omega-hydroxylase
MCPEHCRVDASAATTALAGWAHCRDGEPLSDRMDHLDSWPRLPTGYQRAASMIQRAVAPVDPATPRLDDIDLSDVAFWGRPPAEREAAFAVLRAQPHPVYFAEPAAPAAFGPPGPGYHALVSHADVTGASRLPEVFCSGRGATSITDIPAEFAEYFGSMINMDDPRHDRLRRIVARAFTQRMVRKFENDVQRTAREVVDELIERGPCDFVTEVAAKLPLRIICEMMGIPGESYQMVLENTNAILAGADPEFVGHFDDAAIKILTAGQRLGELVQDLAGHRKRHPSGDLVSALVTANIDGEALTFAEIASFFILLVVAGNETTRNAISHALLLLTDFPDQRSLLLQDIDRHIGGAVEEIVRIASPVIFMRRTLTKEYELNGHRFRAGEKVVLYYWSANRDETVFTDPARFDILRRPNPHVGFGAPGPHFCLGAHLARRELTVMLRELLLRLPAIRADGEPDRLLSSFINGIKHLRCELTP